MLKTSIKAFPEGYQQLQYINSTGVNAYINTETAVGSDIDFEIQFICTELSESSECGIFGAFEWQWYKGARQPVAFYLLVNNYSISQNKAYFWFNYGISADNETWNLAIPADKVITIKMHDKVATISYDGFIPTEENNGIHTFVNDFSLSYPAYLGCVCGDNRGPAYQKGSSINYFKMWKAGQLVCEYYPMRKTDGNIIGMYDATRASDPFVSSSTDQNFIAGPNVDINTVHRIYTKYNGEMKRVKKMYTTAGGHKENPVLVFEEENTIFETDAAD